MGWDREGRGGRGLWLAAGESVKENQDPKRVEGRGLGKAPPGQGGKVFIPKHKAFTPSLLPPSPSLCAGLQLQPAGIPYTHSCEPPEGPALNPHWGVCVGTGEA